MQLFKEYRGLRKELYVLFFGRIVTNLGSMIWPMLTLILKNKLNMPASEIATYTLIITLLSFPIGLIGGKLADRYNKRNIIIISDCISIVCYIICGLMPFSRILIPIMALASIMQTFEWPSYDALVIDLTTPSERERAFSLSYLGANLGLILSPTIAGFLVNNYLSLAFIINATSIALSTILIFLLVKNVEKSVSEEDINIYENELEGNRSTFSFLKTSRVLIIFIIMSALGNAMYNQYNFLMPLDMSAVYGEQGSIIYGTVSSTNCIVVVLCTALITHLTIKIRDINKMQLGTILELLGLFIFMIGMKILLVCYISIIIFTFGEILNTISSTPFESKRIPSSHRGRIGSIVNITCDISNALFTKLTGYLYDTKGSMFSWQIVIITGIICILLMFIMGIFDKKDYKELYKKI